MKICIYICSRVSIQWSAIYNIGNYEFLGCFKDNQNRDMVNPVITQTNSLEFCGNRCGNKGYRFFGVQVSNSL